MSAAETLPETEAEAARGAPPVAIDAVLAAAKAAGGTLYNAPLRAGLAPRARWDVCLTMQRAGFLELVGTDRRTRTHRFRLTPAGYAAAVIRPEPHWRRALTEADNATLEAAFAALPAGTPRTVTEAEQQLGRSVLLCLVNEMGAPATAEYSARLLGWTAPGTPERRLQDNAWRSLTSKLRLIVKKTISPASEPAAAASAEPA